MKLHSRPGIFRKSLLMLLIAATAGQAVLWAQTPIALNTPAAAPTSSTAALGAPTESTASAVKLLVGRSTIVDVGSPIARVSLTSADIADALVTSPNQLLINGKLPGTISMFVWDRGGALRRYEVSVQRDLARLADQMRELFPGESIQVQSNGKNVVLSGMVSNKDLIEKAVNVAAGYVEKKEEVTTLLKIQPGGPSNQVLLRVRFAEVSRSAMTELGLSLAANGYDGRFYGRSSTQQFGAPSWNEDGKFVFSDFLNLFLFDSKNQLAGVLRAMQAKGLFQSLAEPNLVAESGKEASFLAGGEFPVPVMQGSGLAGTVTVLFKEFGIRLNFTPTVNGDRVHLKVRPEVSTLDFTNAVVLQGFRVPALSTRRTETELELQSGQTFAIAGLINNTMNSTMQKIPGIGDIPILGNLFKSKAAQKNQTELVVMITPEILPNNSRGVTPNLPRTPDSFLPTLPTEKSRLMPPAAFSGQPSAAASEPAPLAAPVVAAAPQPAKQAPVVAARPKQAESPSTAAVKMTALTPSAPKQAQKAAAAPSNAAQAPKAKTAAAPSNAAQDRKATEQARRDEQRRIEEQRKADEREKAEERTRTAEEKRQTVRAEQEAREAAKQRAREERLAKEQADRDAEAAREAEAAAKKQAELERKHQAAIGEAQAKLKAAQSAYEAEVARAGKN